MTDINQLIHAYVTEGACWHEFSIHPLKDDNTFDWHHCRFCGMSEGDLKIGEDIRPDYSTPDNFKKLTDKLFGDERMYEAFEYHAGTAWANSGTHQYMMQWLFSDYARFVALFAEFLRLPETVREFGYKECSCKSRGWDIAKCHQCNGTGKILRPWAKLVEEENHGG